MVMEAMLSTLDIAFNNFDADYAVEIHGDGLNLILLQR